MLVFIDASDNMDRDGFRVFLLLTHCVLGGLPLGAFIATNESESTIKEGLMLLLSLIHPCFAFGHCGRKGPVLFMTDDNAAERHAL